MMSMTTKIICVAPLVAALLGACQPEAPAPAADPPPSAEQQPAAQPEPAAQAAPATPAAAPSSGAGEQATAVYQVGPLDLAGVGALNQALGGRECVLATRPDMEQGRFEVTYSADQCCPNSIKGLLAAVRPDVTLERVDSASPAEQVDDQGSCGGCPYKNSCDKGGE